MSPYPRPIRDPLPMLERAKSEWGGCGDLGSAQQYGDIFASASGRYGTTLDYASKTLHCLREHGIHDPALHRVLAHARDRNS